MESIQLSGLISGFDSKSVVDQLIQLERTPQNRLRVEKNDVSKEVTALETLESRLKALADASEDLQESDLYFGRTAVLGDPESTILTASADSKTQVGDYEFVITQLATQTLREGSADVAAAINSTSDVSGVTVSAMNLTTAITDGFFTIDGAQVTVAGTDSLQDVFDAISTATSGAVTATYDPVQDEIALSSASEIVLGSPNDTSNFLLSTKLFSNGTGSVSSASSLGTIKLDSTIANAGLDASITNVDANGDGVFSINGEEISFNVNDDSVRNIIERISVSTADVSLSYDSVGDKFTLTNKDTGSFGLSVSETAGGFLAALGLTTSATVTLGENANFTVNGGGLIISNSNEFDDNVHGITGLTATAKELGTETTTVSAENGSVRTKVDAFIEKYNFLQAYIKNNTAITVKADEVTTKVFSDNREVTSLGRDLRAEVFASVPSLTGTVKRLQDMGINFKTDSDELEIDDEDAFEDALKDNPDAVATLFTDTNDGIANSLEAFIDGYVASNGILDTQKDILNDRTRKLDDQILAMERTIEFKRQVLEGSFLRMELAQAKIQQQLQALNNSFQSV